jgi:hypothetical protein
MSTIPSNIQVKPSDVCVLIMLCVIIILKIKLPPYLLTFGIVPITIVLLFLVLYLFTQSPILGIVGLIAAYSLIQTKESRSIPTLSLDGDLTSANQFQETLEEYMVKRIVPLVQSPSPTHLNFKYTNENTHDAAPL